MKIKIIQILEDDQSLFLSYNYETNEIKPQEIDQDEYSYSRIDMEDVLINNQGMPFNIVSFHKLIHEHEEYTQQYLSIIRKDQLKLKDDTEIILNYLLDSSQIAVNDEYKMTTIDNRDAEEHYQNFKYKIHSPFNASNVKSKWVHINMSGGEMGNLQAFLDICINLGKAYSTYFQIYNQFKVHRKQEPIENLVIYNRVSMGPFIESKIKSDQTLMNLNISEDQFKDIVKKENQEVIQTMLDSVEIKQWMFKGGRTLLHLAIESANTQVVRMIKSKDCFDLTQLDSKNKSYLCQAVGVSSDLAQYLLQCLFPTLSEQELRKWINTTCFHKNQNALHRVCRRAKAEMQRGLEVSDDVKEAQEMLCWHECDKHLKDRYGESPAEMMAKIGIVI